MHVAMRCDASSSLGVGHLVRTLAAAAEFAACGHDVTIIGRFDTAWAARLVDGSGHRFAAPPPSWEALPEQLVQLAADALLVDHYSAPTGLHVALAPHGIVLANTQDGPWGRRPADITVDTSGDAGEEAPHRLHGPRHALLRRSVITAREQRSTRSEPPTVRRALAVLGGTDATGLLPRLARLVLESLGPDASLEVVQPRDNTAPLPITDDRLTTLGPTDDLPALFARADLVVGAAGTTVWELACIGVPMALVAVVPNQQVVYDAAITSGIAVGLGRQCDLGADVGAILTSLVGDQAARLTMVARARALVDGGGAARLVAAVENAVARQLHVRVADLDDADLLLAWRNDPATRSSSRDKALVDSTQHLTWLTRALADDSRHLLVVSDAGGAPVATLRWDGLEGDVWEVSVTVAPAARGRGVARAALAAAEEWLLATRRPRQLVAVVHPNNAASLRLFEGAGYARTTGVDAAGYCSLVKVPPGG